MSYRETETIAKIVNYGITGTPYTTTAIDYTLRFNGNITANSGVILHDPTTTPGKIMVLSNSCQTPQTITGVVHDLVGSTFLTSLPPESSHTIQSVEGVWVVIDRDLPNLAANFRVGKTSPVATAVVNTECVLGQLKFRYDANTVGGNLAVQSSGTAISFHWGGYEQFPGIGITQNCVGGLTAPATGTTWLSLPVGGAGANEILRYVIGTASNLYIVVITCIAGTNVTLFVEKAI